MLPFRELSQSLEELLVFEFYEDGSGHRVGWTLISGAASWILGLEVFPAGYLNVNLTRLKKRKDREYRYSTAGLVGSKKYQRHRARSVGSGKCVDQSTHCSIANW
jgi:hypothetical protein